MDRSKIKGILDAIETEAKQPQPSHANLARLTAMALNEVLNLLPIANEPVIAPASEPETPVETSDVEPSSDAA